MRLENTFLGVDGVGETTERNLWQAGVTHWDEFHRNVDGVGERRAARIGAFIDEGRNRLSEGDAGFFAGALPGTERWRLYENFREDTAYFDIETTGLDPHHDRVTTVSIHQAGETRTFVRGRDLTAERLSNEFDQASVIISFNGAQFDIPFLERSFDLTIELPHIDLMYPLRRLNLSGGLKAIERQVGIDRERPDITGRDAVRLWYDYAHSGDVGALETLVQYNRADTRNLERLMEFTATRLHEEVFEPLVPG